MTVDAFTKLKEEFDTLQFAGIGGSSDNDKITGFALSLNYYGARDKAQIRHIFLRIIDVLLETINASEEIQPYLARKPATTDDLDIGLIIHGSDGSLLDYPHISIVYLSHGSITYLTTENDGIGTKTDEEETLETARQLNQQN